MSLGAGPQYSNYPAGFANGINIRGVPLLQSNPGRVYWLNNSGVSLPGGTNCSDNNPGTFQKPFASLAGALAQCQQNRGDVILVGAGHREVVNGAGTTVQVVGGLGTTLTLNCAGVAIIGMGAGNSRPTFVFSTANTANLPLQASNMSLQNILFEANFLAVASAITAVGASVTASIAAGSTPAVGTPSYGVMTVTVVGSGTIYPGCTLVSGTNVAVGTVVLNQLTGSTGGVGTYTVDVSQTVASTTITTGTPEFAVDNCEFRDLSATLNFVDIFTTGTTTNACSGLSLTRNQITLAATSGAVALVNATGTNDRVYIADNNWISLSTNAAALIPIAAGKILTNFNLLRNHFNIQNATGTATGYLLTTNQTTNTGFIDGNVDHALPTTPLLCTASSGFVYGINYHSDQPDTSGYVNPAQDS